MNEALSSYFAVVRRAWRLIAAITLLCVCGSALMLLFVPAKYESTSALLVSTPRDNEGTGYRGDEYSRQRRSTYAALVASPELAQRVIDDMALPITPARLISQTTVALVPDTVLISLTTEGSTPSEAQGTAQAYVQELTRSVAALEAVPGGLTPRAELILVQPPTYDATPAGFAPWLILGAAGVGGLIVSSFVVVLMSLLDGRVRGPEDAVEAASAPLLASFVFDARRQGDQLPNASVGESARVLRTCLDGVLAERRRVVMISAVEQSTTATRVALELSRVLADRKSSVVLVDLNGRTPDSLAQLRLEDGPTVSSLLALSPESSESPDSFASPQPEAGGALRLDDRPLSTWHGVAVLPFGESTEDPGSTADDPNLAHLLARLGDRYDWVVVDTPPIAVYSDAVRLARHCDAAVVVVHMGKTRFDALRTVGDELGRSGNGIAGVVMSNPAPAIEAEPVTEPSATAKL